MYFGGNNEIMYGQERDREIFAMFKNAVLAKFINQSDVYFFLRIEYLQIK